MLLCYLAVNKGIGLRTLIQRMIRNTLVEVLLDHRTEFTAMGIKPITNMIGDTYNVKVTLDETFDVNDLIMKEEKQVCRSLRRSTRKDL